MASQDKPLSHYQNQVSFPKLRLPTKVAISQKTLQIYIDCKSPSPNIERMGGRVVSYSKLLQEHTPETFRKQRSTLGGKPVLKPRIRIKDLSCGIQGIKSPLTDRHSKGLRLQIAESRRLNHCFTSKRVDKGLNCSFDAEENQGLQLAFKRDPNAPKRADPPPTPSAPPTPSSQPPFDLADVVSKPAGKPPAQSSPPKKPPTGRKAKSPAASKTPPPPATTAKSAPPPPSDDLDTATEQDEATYDPGTTVNSPMDVDEKPQPATKAKKGKKWYPIPKDLKDAPVRGLCTKVRGGAKVIGMKTAKKQTQASTGPLGGKTFVITGVMEGVERDELEGILKGYGAKITGSVSKRTSYLVYGEKLEDGRVYTEGKKYQRAKELGVKIVSQKELDQLIMRVRSGDTDQEPPPSLPPPTEPSKKTTKPPPTPAPPPQKKAKTANPPSASVLWTVKYSPQSLKDLIGNAPAIEKLITWVKDWPTVVLKGQKKDSKPMRGGRFDPQLNVNAKAALVSGPPGIGKTTTVRLIAKELGYRAVEMNASDVRSKTAILEPLKASSGSTALTDVGGLTKTLVIMDEVDGMSAGDRGGVSALAEVIKLTHVPIICICNERSSPKLKQLSNVSYDIRFSRPNKTQISKRLAQIAAKEGLQIEANGLEHIVECSGNDIRQVFTMLEMWGRSSDSLSFCDAKSTERTYRKDANVMLNNFDAASLLLRREELAKRSFRERMDLFFIDFDLIPLLIQENYVTAMGVNTETKTLEKMAQASASIAFGDVINRLIRNQNEWALLNAYGLASCVDPGVRSGFGVPFPKFPEWFGRNSAQKKNERLLREVRSAMAGFVSGSDEDLITDYIPLMYQLLMRPMREQGRDGVPETFELMETYNVTPDMLRDHFIQLQFGPAKYEEEYKVIPTQVKSALTRMHNAATAITSSGGKGRKKTTFMQQTIGEQPVSEGEQEPPAEEVGKFDPDIEERA